MEQYWRLLAQRYGRDYAWLDAAMEMYGGRVRQSPGTACITFVPAGDMDFGEQYGLAPGLVLHFLLVDMSAPVPDRAVLLPQPPGEKDRLCIPVKTGRAASGWQLGLRLDAIRPLALLRPFYLFCTPQAAPCAGEVRRIPPDDPRRLGRLLDNGWAGVDRCALTQEILLQKRL